MRDFETMTEAVEAARDLCPCWMEVHTGLAYEADELMGVTKALMEVDGADSKARGVRYVCSDEGAIGVMEEFEFMTQWLLIPVMVSKAEFEDEVASIQMDILLAMEEQEAAASKQQGQPVSTVSQVKPQPSQQPSPQTHALCKKCGTKLTPGMAFCMNCGTKIE